MFGKKHPILFWRSQTLPTDLYEIYHSYSTKVVD